MEKSMNDILEEIIGDVPVSEQLNAALAYMATKDQVHELYAEIEFLKQEVENLIALVGDESVSAQINNAIKPFTGI